MTTEDPQSLTNPCQFGPWHFDPVDGKLISKNNEVRLQPRLAKLLALFLGNVDALLTRNHLIDLLWQDKSINEDALSRCIAELRSTLGDNRNSPLYIETVPKRGYRFIHPLSKPSTKGNPRKIVYIGISLILIGIFSTLSYQDISLGQPPNSISLSSKLKDSLSASKRATANVELEHHPELSSRGDKIVFITLNNNRYVVKVISLDGSLIHEIVDPELHLVSPTFSPDDQALLVAGLSKGECTIYQYDLPSLNRKLIGNCDSPSRSAILDWSPDGSSIAYVDKIESSDNSSKLITTSIWLYDIESNSHTQLTHPAELNVFDTRPKFSPDGNRLAFTRGTRSIRNIYSVSLDDPSTTQIISSGNGYITGFDWMADSQHLIFDSNELGDRNLWIIDRLIGKQQLLGARNAQFPSLDQNNNFLIYQEIRFNANIWSVNLEEPQATAKRIIHSIKYNSFPSYSPNGDQIAFVSNRHGKSSIWLYSPKSNKQDKLLSILDLDLTTPNWSNDGSKMLVSSRGTSGYRCYEIDLSSKQFKKITAIPQAHYGCLYSPQGDIFAISKVPFEATYLLKLNTKGQVQQLTDYGVGNLQVSNENRIVFTLQNDDGIYSLDFNGENKKTIIGDFSYTLDEHWTARNSHLYYPRLGDKRGIWRRDLTTGKEEFVTKELPTAIGLTINVNHDQTKILMSRTDNREADIYIAKLKTDLTVRSDVN